MKVEFYHHQLGEEEMAALSAAIQSPFLTMATRTARFEQAFAELLGVEHVVGLNSCSAALHLALLALGVGPGDEVIAPAMTYVATVTPIWWVGATPVLADVDPRTGLLEAPQVERRLTPRTKAVIVVHLYGNMVDMRALRALCDQRGVALVEDAAHCVEGSRDGVGPGQLSSAACFSFYATKNLTSGEGGALATNDAGLAERVRLLRMHGISKSAAQRYESRSYQHWDMVELGYKCHMYDLQAALLMPQLPKLGAYLERREAIARAYERALRDVAGVELPGRAPGTTSARHLFTIWVDPDQRDALLQYLTEHDIGCAVNYRALHVLSYFRKRFGLAPDALPNAYRIGTRTVSLPLYVSLSEEQQGRVVEVVRAGVGSGRPR